MTVISIFIVSIIHYVQAFSTSIFYLSHHTQVNRMSYSAYYRMPYFYNKPKNALWIFLTIPSVGTHRESTWYHCYIPTPIDTMTHSFYTVFYRILFYFSWYYQVFYRLQYPKRKSVGISFCTDCIFRIYLLSDVSLHNLMIVMDDWTYYYWYYRRSFDIYRMEKCCT